MENVAPPVTLIGREIHGFNTSADLDIAKLMEEACTRWLRPNEVHAILSNYSCFRIQPQPVDTPSSGTLLLFDRKMLRNFRKDGHNWRKKKDGKTVQEAHEKLKIGNEERIHVYYARNEDDPNFYRRCYWLLDRDFERIVLVHYRQTSEENAIQLSPTPIESGGTTKTIDSPVTPLNSASASDHSDLSGSVVVSDEINSLENCDIYTGPSSRTTADHSSAKLTIDALDKLGWEQIMEQPADIDLSASNGKLTLVNAIRGAQMLAADENINIKHNNNNILQSLDSFERWNACVSSSPSSVEDPQLQCLHSDQGQIFSIMDISPSWAYLMQEAKIILVGKYADSYTHLEGYKIFCRVGDMCVPVEVLKNGVYRIMIKPQRCGTYHLFLTIDGQTPISDVINFECKANSETLFTDPVTSTDSIDSELHPGDNMKYLVRLCHLLFSTTKTVSALSARSSPNCMKEAKKFSLQTSSTLEKEWMHLLRSNENVSLSSSITRQLLEISLKNKLQEWILSNIVEGCKTIPRDTQGQGVIHLCAILDYAWAINLFALSNISLDVRDVSGWTALHWAAYYGREKTVAALLSAGANPSLVTDPTHDFPGGCTASDLASQQGYEGLGAYLAEKGLQAHFQAMKLSGNISSPSPFSVDPISSDVIESENISEQELCLKDSLAAYRNAADAADRIQAAFRERSHKQQMKAAQLEKNQDEAQSIVAALKIQKAYRNYNSRKMMKAAARIQGVFRTWQARKNFLNMRRQIIRIQAIFRGHQTRKQYHKIVWSVGVLEKAVLRWRLKRKGLRGLQAESSTTVTMVVEENCVEEDFYRISREQAEERVKRSVVRVQAMFRSYRAQQQYRRMKLVHNQAKLEYSDLSASRQHFSQW